MVAQSVIFHVNSDQVIKSGSREAQDARYLLGVEQISCLVPVDPHAPQVVSKEVVQRIAGQETQAVRNPVGFVAVVEEVGLNSFPEIANRLGPLLVGSGPHAKSDAVEGM